MENGTATGLDSIGGSLLNGLVDDATPLGGTAFGDATRPADAPSLGNAPSLDDAALLAALGREFAVRRAVDARLVALTAEVLHRSRPSLRPDGLAFRFGATSAAALLAEVGLITLAESHRFCRVAEATTARVTLTGEHRPAAFLLVADAVHAGLLPLDSAQHIVVALSQASPRAEPGHLAVAETALVGFAVEHPADLVRRLATRWRDALDVDGIEPREAELVAGRSLRRTILANGLKRYRLDLDTLSSAYLDAAIDAHVGAAIRAPRFTSADDAATGGSASSGEDPVPDTRTVSQMGADAVVDLARHGIACNNQAVPLPATTIIVRMTLQSLLDGLGEAQLDGTEQPISAGTARRLAADAGIIPEVLGGPSEVLDLGATRRLFSRAQRLALAERDGGCAITGCLRPPSHTEAHHIHPWARTKNTNLANGILLCTAHHHDIHRNGWHIDIIDNVPWFTPPISIDPQQRPRRGGKPPPPIVPIVQRQ